MAVERFNVGEHTKDCQERLCNRQNNRSDAIGCTFLVGLGKPSLRDDGHRPGCSVYRAVLRCRGWSICEMCRTDSAEGGSWGKRIITENRDVAV